MESLSSAQAELYEYALEHRFVLSYLDALCERNPKKRLDVLKKIVAERDQSNKFFM